MARAVHSALLPAVTGAHPDRTLLFRHDDPESGLSAERIQVELRRFGRSLGMRTLGTHTLRRTFGRMAYDAGVDLLTIRDLLGHTTVEMTARHIGIRIEKLAAGLARTEAFALAA